MQPKIPYACQKHNSPMDRRLSMNNRTIAIPFEPGMTGVSQENPFHSCGIVTHVEHGLGFVICTLIYLVERLHMLLLQQAIETFLGFETKQYRICVIKQKITLIEFYDLCHSQWLCIAYRI